VKKSASLPTAAAGIASILASFHVVPSSFLSWPALPQAAIIISSAAAAKYFFITYL